MIVYIVSFNNFHTELVPSLTNSTVASKNRASIFHIRIELFSYQSWVCISSSAFLQAYRPCKLVWSAGMKVWWWRWVGWGQEAASDGNGTFRNWQFRTSLWNQNPYQNRFGYSCWVGGDWVCQKKFIGNSSQNMYLHRHPPVSKTWMQSVYSGSTI